jgi:AraC-like DNA-binding protein
VTLPVVITIFIFIFGYLGLRQPEIILPVEEETVIKKYEKSTLTDEKGEVHLQLLLEVMDKSKPFLKNDLTLQKLAALLDISTHHLSQIINERLNQNFFDFINSYRIEDAKQKLLSPDFRNYTILAIAEECGFNSKSSFNTAFKKFTDQTPSEFRKNAEEK